MITRMYIMSNDAKWMERIEDLSFTPYPGMDFTGSVGEQPLRISGMSYDVVDRSFKVRLAWLSHEPLTSAQMVELGWAAKST
jgi:hypothetical protein